MKDLFNCGNETQKYYYSDLEKLDKNQLIAIIQEMKNKYLVSERITEPIDIINKTLSKIKSDKNFDCMKEHFIVLMLNIRNDIIDSKIISMGHLSGSLVHPREVFKAAIKASANSIIIAHNHPSGNSEPSKGDDTITKMIADAGEIMNIQLVDHIIFTAGPEFYSYSENGKM